jgi:ankyrin repeat protein
MRANGINNGQAQDTALMATVGKRQLAATRLLRERGADPNPKAGMSPLKVATMQANQEMEDLLTQYGASDQ